MAVLIGTSGWQYRDWRGRFYPDRLPQRRWLDHYVDNFATVEVNSTFYRLPTVDTVAGWRARLPDGFAMALKVSGYLTHRTRLRQPQEPVARFLQRATELGPHLGPVLIQLPPTLGADLGALTGVLDLFPAPTRVAFEPRHPSWSTDEVAAALAERDVALCLADRHHRPTTPVGRTASWGYVRFHEGAGRPRPRYGAAALQEWADRLAALWAPDEDVYVYFNNDPGGAAVTDAAAFAGCARRAGLTPTRVPWPGAG